MSTKCSNCGAALADGDIFCDNCGAHIEQSAPPVSIFCEQCGTMNNAHDRFCKSCGAQLTDEAHVSESEHEHVPPATPTQAPKSSKPIIIAIVGAIAAVVAIAVAVALNLRVAANSKADEATATKIINDMRAAKSAGLLIYMDNDMSWSWATPNNVDKAAKMIDQYMDHPLFSGKDSRCSLLFKNDVRIQGDNGSETRSILIGFQFDSSVINDGVRKKLQYYASRSGLYNADGSYYDGRGQAVFMALAKQETDSPSTSHSSPPTTASRPQPQRTDRDDSFSNTSQNYAHEYAGYGPASFRYVPCSGWVQADTKDGSLLNVRGEPAVVDPIVFQVPDNSKLRVDGWAWDEIRGNNSYWLRVVDHGGYVIGWVSQEFCNVSHVDFHGTRPYASNWTSAQTRSGSSVTRKHDPAAYYAHYATGHITVTAQNHDLNVRPAPGVVDDVVFIITDKYGCKVNGWSYDQFESGSERVWLRLTDNHDNILGWVNAAYCNTKHVEFD